MFSFATLHCMEIVAPSDCPRQLGGTTCVVLPTTTINDRRPPPASPQRLSFRFVRGSAFIAAMAEQQDAAAEQARLRKERREAKIKAGGSARLDKITGIGGRVVGGA